MKIFRIMEDISVTLKLCYSGFRLSVAFGFKLLR